MSAAPFDSVRGCRRPAAIMLAFTSTLVSRSARVTGSARPSGRRAARRTPFSCPGGSRLRLAEVHHAVPPVGPGNTLVLGVEGVDVQVLDAVLLFRALLAVQVVQCPAPGGAAPQPRLYL